MFFPRSMIFTRSCAQRPPPSSFVFYPSFTIHRRPFDCPFSRCLSFVFPSLLCSLSRSKIRGLKLFRVVCVEFIKNPGFALKIASLERDVVRRESYRENPIRFVLFARSIVRKWGFNVRRRPYEDRLSKILSFTAASVRSRF